METPTKPMDAAYGHDCELDFVDSMDLMHIIPGKSRFVRAKRWIVSRIVIDAQVSKLYNQHMRSDSARAVERHRQWSEYPFRIHPFSIARANWAIVMSFLILLQLVTVPLDCLLCHFTSAIVHKTVWLIFRAAIDVCCCLNVFVTLITGIYDEPNQTVQFNFSRIFWKYFKGRMFLDLFLSFPYSLLEIPDSDRYTTVSLQILISFKVLLIFHWFDCLKMLADYIGLHYYSYVGMLVFILTISYWHMACCLITFVRIYGRPGIAFEYRGMTDAEALDAYYISIEGAVGIYVASVYHGSFIIYTSGYGKSRPRNDVDCLIITLAWYISRGFFIFILALMLQIIRGVSSSRYKYLLMERQLLYYMNQKQFSRYLQRRILTYYHFRFHRRFFKEYEILDSLSEQLRQEIHMQSCRKLVESVVFFSNLPMKLLVKIISCLKKEIYLINDVIVRHSTPGRSMYFIAYGAVAIYTKSGKEICHLHEGAYFGEVALIIKDTMRVATVVAAEISEIYRLDHKDFVKAINPYPDLLANITQIATDRMEMATILDDYNKRDKDMSRRFMRDTLFR